MILTHVLKKARMTQRRFARLVGVSQARISQLVNGQTPSLALALRIAERTKGEVPVHAWSTKRARGGKNKRKRG